MILKMQSASQWTRPVKKNLALAVKARKRLKEDKTAHRRRERRGRGGSIGVYATRVILASFVKRDRGRQVYLLSPPEPPF